MNRPFPGLDPLSVLYLPRLGRSSPSCLIAIQATHDLDVAGRELIRGTPSVDRASRYFLPGLRTKPPPLQSLQQ
jgi:hypothetical protein